MAPDEGSFGGGTPIVITGTGFDVGDVEVTVCDNVCTITSASTSQIECLTPANDATDAELVCDVTVTQPSGEVTDAGAFT